MSAGARILVVEDNSENLLLIRVLLEAFGHTPILATSGAEGIEIASREDVDLILMDIQMPEMDGIEAMQAIRSDPRRAGAPIVALTAFAMVGDREAGLEAGFDGYLTKPIDPPSFAVQLDAFLPPALRSAEARPSSTGGRASDDAASAGENPAAA